MRTDQNTYRAPEPGNGGKDKSDLSDGRPPAGVTQTEDVDEDDCGHDQTEEDGDPGEYRQRNLDGLRVASGLPGVR